MQEFYALNKYIGKYKGRFFLGIVFIVISRYFSLYPAKFVRETIDQLEINLGTYTLLPASFSLDFKNYLIAFIIVVILGIVATSLINGLFLFLTRQTIIVMSRYIESDIKDQLFSSYLSMKISDIKKNSTGDLMNRISEDVSRVRMYFGPAIMYSINLGVLFIVVISTMIQINPVLTFYSLTPLPLLSFIVYKVSKRINHISEKVQRELSNLTSISQQSFQGIQVIKAYVQEKQIEEKFNHSSEEYLKVNLKLGMTNALFFPFITLLIGLSIILTIYVGGIKTIGGEVSKGNIAEFIIYVNMLIWPFTAVGWVSSLMQRAKASFSRIQEFLLPALDDTVDKGAPFKFNKEMAFDRVEILYPETNIKALKEINFSIAKGESLGIVGKTGSGKSSIASLLTKLYQPTRGAITIDGVDISHYNTESLREAIAYVPQDAFLFSDTIENNILFGSQQKISQKEINKIIELSCLKEDIDSFPSGIKTEIGEKGISLSGGQRQRLAIARALLRNSEIIILDDSFSALDQNTENQIIGNIHKYLKHKTSIVISHRISAVQHCSNIIVLKDGLILENGSHQSLIQQHGYYQKMHEIQGFVKKLSNS